MAVVNSAASTIASLDEGRRQPRTHQFVAATIYFDAGAAPARIRNMSPSGALIEGANMPDPCTAVTLKRGSLQAFGQIAWKVDQKAGIAFSTTVHVASWMSRQPSSHQAQVDSIVADLKAGKRVNACGQVAEAFPDISSMATQLLELRADLAQLGDSLIKDLALIATHPEIQFLDISVQRLDRMIRQLR